MVPRSDESKDQGEMSRSPGIKLKRRFSALSAACVWFMFGKTCLVYSVKLEVIDIKFLNHTVLENVTLSFVKELSMSGTTFLWMLILVP